MKTPDPNRDERPLRHDETLRLFGKTNASLSDRFSDPVPGSTPASHPRYPELRRSRAQGPMLVPTGIDDSEGSYSGRLSHGHLHGLLWEPRDFNDQASLVSGLRGQKL